MPGTQLQTVVRIKCGAWLLNAHLLEEQPVFQPPSHLSSPRKDLAEEFLRLPLETVSCEGR